MRKNEKKKIAAVAQDGGPFPRRVGDKLIIDELCHCGARRSLHSGVGPVWGHGDCPTTGCPRFTWRAHVPGLAAYTAVLLDAGFGLGVATLNSPGYMPRPDRGLFPSFEAATSAAETLNAELGLDRDQAIRVVLTSMGAPDSAVGIYTAKRNGFP